MRTDSLMRDAGRADGSSDKDVHKDDAHKDKESLSPAVTRAVAILDALAVSPTKTLGTSELARQLGLPKSSISNICGALVSAGMARRIGTGFALGRKVVHLSGAYLASMDIVQEVDEAVGQLGTASEETVQLAVLEGLEVCYVYQHNGDQPVRLVPGGIGRRLPAMCTAVGKAMLAKLDDEELERRFASLDELPRLTPRSHRTFDALMKDLRAIRERGYSVDDEEAIEGVLCLAVSIPQRSVHDEPYAASVTLLKARATPERIQTLVADLNALAGRFSAR